MQKGKKKKEMQKSEALEACVCAKRPANEEDACNLSQVQSGTRETSKGGPMLQFSATIFAMLSMEKIAHGRVGAKNNELLKILTGAMR